MGESYTLPGYQPTQRIQKTLHAALTSHKGRVKSGPEVYMHICPRAECQRFPRTPGPSLSLTETGWIPGVD